MIKIHDTVKSMFASIFSQANDDVTIGMAYEMVGLVKEEHLPTMAEKAVYRAIKNALDEKCDINLSTINDRLGDNHLDYILEIATVSTSPNISKHISAILNYHKYCSVKTALTVAMNDLNSTDNISEALDKAESVVMKGFTDNYMGKKDEGYVKDYASEYWKMKQEQMNTNSLVGIASGIEPLDKLTGGFRGGDIVVIAGRSGMGKSSFAMTMIANQIMAGHKPALFSFELKRLEIMDKLISMLSEFDNGGDTIPFLNLHNPAGHFGGVGLNGKMLDRSMDITRKYIKDCEMFIRGANKANVNEVMSMARRLVAEGCDILYLDHIGLMVEDKRNERADLVNITNSLKLFACEMDIPVVEVVQLSREADNAGAMPKLSHLKGSGSIEEDANIVLMPWRPYAITKEGDETESTLYLAKGRNAPEGMIPMKFSTTTTSFTANISKEGKIW